MEEDVLPNPEAVGVFSAGTVVTTTTNDGDQVHQTGGAG